MKNLKFLILALFSLSLIYSCRSEEKYYEGDTKLHFNTSTEAESLVKEGESKVVSISYGTLKNVSEDNNVTLVIDQDASDNLQAGAIEILNEGQSVIKKGTAISNFEVKLNGDYLTSDAKKVVFRLESSSLENAVFNQTFTLSASKVCPITSFVGNFANDAAWWVETPNPTFDIVEGTAPNSLIIKDFFEPGRDFNLTYDPETFVVSFEMQFTGWTHAQGQVFAKKGESTSTLNPCTRELDLHVEYVIPGVGTFGEKNEHFTGL